MEGTPFSCVFLLRGSAPPFSTLHRWLFCCVVLWQWRMQLLTFFSWFPTIPWRYAHASTFVERPIGISSPEMNREWSEYTEIDFSKALIQHLEWGQV